MSQPTPGTFIVQIPDGVQIRDPETKQIVKSGTEVPRNEFWNRRLYFNEVTEQAATPAAAPAIEPQHRSTQRSDRK